MTSLGHFAELVELRAQRNAVAARIEDEESELAMIDEEIADIEAAELRAEEARIAEEDAGDAHRLAMSWANGHRI